MSKNIKMLLLAVLAFGPASVLAGCGSSDYPSGAPSIGDSRMERPYGQERSPYSQERSCQGRQRYQEPWQQDQRQDRGRGGGWYQDRDREQDQWQYPVQENDRQQSRRSGYPASGGCQNQDAGYQTPSRGYENPNSTQDAPNDSQSSDSPVSTTGGNSIEQEIFNGTNQQRAQSLGSGSALSRSSILDKVAAARVADMFENQYFDHNSPNGSNASALARQYGYRYSTLGENIAYGSFSNGGQIMNGWMNSSGHRENILARDYNEIGIAASQGNFNGRNVWIAVQVFGSSGR